MLQLVNDHGSFLSSHNVCLSPGDRDIQTDGAVNQTDGTQMAGASKNDVSTGGTVRASDLPARARQRKMDGQTVSPFSVGSVFDASLMHERGCIPGGRLED